MKDKRPTGNRRSRDNEGGSGKERSSGGFKGNDNMNSRGKGRPSKPFDKNAEERPKRTLDKDTEGRSGRNFSKYDSRSPRANALKPFDKQSEDRPRRNFSKDDSRPPERFDNKEGGRPTTSRDSKPFDKSWGNRPKRSFNKDDNRPPRKFDNKEDSRPARGRDSKQFNKSGEGSPKRSFSKDDSRPPRKFDNQEGGRPPRKFDEGGEHPAKRFNKDNENKPQRAFDKSGERPPRRVSADKKFSKEHNKDKGKPKRAFGKDDPNTPKKFSERNIFHEDKPAKPTEDYEKNFITPKEFEKTLEDKPQFAGIKAKQEDTYDKAFPLGTKKVSGPFRKKQEGDTGAKQRRPKKETEATEDSKDMTLNKYIAHSGTCSRREAAEMVKQGKVKVNGELELDPGYRVKEYDMVTIAGKKLTPTKNRVYILLNKPKGYITTTDDPEGRETVMDLVQDAGADRLYPVGRLDRNTTGLLLLTNDGDLAQKLSHPSYETKKVYQVTLNKPLAKADFDKILAGLTLEDGDVTVDALSYLDNKNELGIEIHSGRNRIVRRIFESLGYEVEKLDRVMYAGLTKKNLPRSKWRFLEEKEVILLKHFKI